MQTTYGMTAPISLAYPKPSDIDQTKQLEKVLSVYDGNESDEEFNHRMDVLSRLNEIVHDWTYQLNVNRNMPEIIAEQVGGRLYTFGSFKLGVHNKGADIDALCAVPRHINRTEYFSSFYDKLKCCPGVKELRAVEEAFVPLIKMNLDGIEIDLVFARLALREIPDFLDLKDDMILKNLDPRCVRSLNGCRVTDEILRLVPNVETFRLALRVIKRWAKQQGIYSNVLGYLSGISWAILVARTCQLYPNAVAATIVHKFFLVFSQWTWPLPVLLKQPTTPNLDFPVWDPRTNVADRCHLLPIITPAYPQQNSTFNVTKSTRTILIKEFKRGLKLTEEILYGKLQWQHLFEKPNFFVKYRHFILLIASSSTKDEHLEWYGLVEAKIRHLVTILERNPLIELAHANPEIFKIRSTYFENVSHSPYQSTTVEGKPNSIWVIGLEFNKNIRNASINLTPEIQNFTSLVMKHATGIKMYKETMEIEAKYVKRQFLQQYIPDEIIKRDRRASEIFTEVENGATILLRKTEKEAATSSPPSTNTTNNHNHSIRRTPFSIINRTINNTPNTTVNKTQEAVKRRSPWEAPIPAKKPTNNEEKPTFGVVSSSSNSRILSSADEIIDLDSDEESHDVVVIEDDDNDYDNTIVAIGL